MAMIVPSVSRTGARARSRPATGRRTAANAPAASPPGARREAQAHLDQTGVDRRDGTWRDPRAGRLVFADWVARWEGTNVHLRPSSQARDDSYLRNHVLPRFGPMRLDAIRVLDVREWVAQLNAKGLAPATVHKAYETLSKVLRSAVEPDLLAQSPCRNVDLPRIERDEMRFLAPVEVAALADSIDPRYRTMILVAAYGGLRLGEVAGLRRAQVDLDKQSVRVIENAVEVHGHIVRGFPKTRAGRRTIPLPPIRGHRPRQSPRRLHRRSPGCAGVRWCPRWHPSRRRLADSLLDASRTRRRRQSPTSPRSAPHRRGPVDRSRRQPETGRRLGRTHLRRRRPRPLRPPL